MASCSNLRRAEGPNIKGSFRMPAFNICQKPAQKTRKGAGDPKGNIASHLPDWAVWMLNHLKDQKIQKGLRTQKCKLCASLFADDSSTHLFEKLGSWNRGRALMSGVSGGKNIKQHTSLSSSTIARLHPESFRSQRFPWNPSWQKGKQKNVVIHVQKASL